MSGWCNGQLLGYKVVIDATLPEDWVIVKGANVTLGKVDGSHDFFVLTLEEYERRSALAQARAKQDAEERWPTIWVRTMTGE